MIPKLPKDFLFCFVQTNLLLHIYNISDLHFEGSKDIFNENTGPDRPSWQPQLILSPDKDPIPEGGLLAPLQLGEVEEGAAALGVEDGSHVVHQQAEVDQGTGGFLSSWRGASSTMHVLMS